MFGLNVVADHLIDPISRMGLVGSGLLGMFLTHHIDDSQSNEPQEEK
jgi:hypothetical protein